MVSRHDTFLIAATAISLVILSSVLFAHHGTGISYDMGKQLVLKGVVTEFRYSNPHPELHFDVTDEKGNVVHWSGELAPNPAELVREGWGKKRSLDALMPGTVVTVTLSPSKFGTSVGVVSKIINEKGEAVVVTTPLPGGGGQGGQRGAQ